MLTGINGPMAIRTVRFGELQRNHADFALGGLCITGGKLDTLGFVARALVDGERKEMNRGR